MTNQIDKDAEEFGLHVRQGEWRLGLLVARSVEKSVGNGVRGPAGGKAVTTATASQKVSANELARLSGTSAARVLRFLDAWDRAAEAEVVPATVDLLPGEELDGLDVDALPAWGDYYDATGSFNLPKAKLPAYEEQAKSSGLTTGAVIRAGKNKAAVAAAIKADPEVAAAARSALGTPTPAEIKDAWKADPAAREAVRDAVRESVDEDRADRELREMASGGTPTPRPVPPKPEIEWGEALSDEVNRRNAISAYLEWAEAGGEIVEAIQSYGFIGVDDEVEWIKQANTILAGYRLKTDEIIVETTQKERR